LKSDVRKLSKHATASKRTSIEDRRRKLESRISNFHVTAFELLGNIEDDEMDILPQFLGFDDDDDDEEEEWDASGSEDESSDGSVGSDSDAEDGEAESAENTVICMPSSFSKGDIERLGLQNLAAQEMELRQGQANDRLKDLRLALGHKALLFRTQLRAAKTSVGKTRAWDDIKIATVKVNKHVRSYRRARKAMERLGADDLILGKYQVLEQEHLKLSGDITEENRVGQRSDALPWFWRLDGQNMDQDDTWMQECEWRAYFYITILNHHKFIG
jgi:hypothetical protein